MCSTKNSSISSRVEPQNTEHKTSKKKRSGAANLFAVADSVITEPPFAEHLLLHQQHIEQVILALQISDLLRRCQTSLRLLRI